MFLRSVICTPFCQLRNFHGPFETEIESLNILFMSWPVITCAGYTPQAAYVSQSAIGFLNTIVTRLAVAP